MVVNRILSFINAHINSADVIEEIQKQQSELKRELVRLQRPKAYGGEALTDEDVRVVACKTEIENFRIIGEFFEFIKNPMLQMKTIEEQLSLFFETKDETAFSQGSIEQSLYYQELSAELDFLKFNEHLKKEKNPSGIIALGQNFFLEPIKLYAFINYLLNSGVTKENIFNSGLFQAYLENVYPFFGADDDNKRSERNVVVGLYRLLEKSSNPRVKLLFQDLQNTKFTIGKGRNEIAIFYRIENIDNPMDRKFATTPMSTELPIQVTSSSTLNFTYERSNILALYQCFQFDFVKALNFTNPNHQEAFSILFAEATKPESSDDFLHKLANYIINESADKDQAIATLNLILNNLPKDESFVKMVEVNPFYLHLLSIMPALLSQVNIDWLNIHIEKLLEQNLSFVHMHLLIKLSDCLVKVPNKQTIIKKIADKIIDQLHIISASAVTNVLLETTFSYGIPQDLLDAIKQSELNLEFEKSILKKLSELKKNLFNPDNIQDISYYEIENIYYDQLPTANLLKQLYKINPQDYPLSKYDLKSAFINVCWSNCKNKNTFSFSSILDTMISTTFSEDPDKVRDEKKRTLLEALVYTTDNELQDAIISELRTTFGFQNWYDEKFGDDSTLLEKAIRSNNTVLSNKMILKMNIPEEYLTTFFTNADNFFQAALANNRPIVEEFIKHNHITQYRIVLAFARVVTENQGDMAIFLYGLLNNESKKLYKKFIIGAIEHAATKGDLRVVKELYNLTDDPSLKQEASSKALVELISLTNPPIQVAEYLCGLPENDAPTLKSIIIALNESVFHNNLNLIRFLCSLTGRYYLSSSDLTAAAKAAINIENINVIAYMCTLEEGKKPDDETLFEAIHIAYRKRRFDLLSLFINSTSNIKKLFDKALSGRPPAWEILKALCDLTGNNRLSKLQISEILRIAATYGELSVVTTIQNMHGDNKPDETDIENASRYTEKLNLLEKLLNTSDQELFNHTITELKQLGYSDWYEEKLKNGKDVIEEAIWLSDTAQNHQLLDMIFKVPDLTLESDTASKVLVYAGRTAKWDIVKLLLDMNPNDFAVSSVFLNLGKWREWDLVIDFCNNYSVKLSSHHVSQVFCEATHFNQNDQPGWDVVLHLIARFGEKIDRDSFAYVLHNAINSENWNVVLQLATLRKGINKEKIYISQTIIKSAFHKVVKINQFDVAIFLYGLLTDDSKTLYKDLMPSAVEAAATQGDLTRVKEFLNLADNPSLKQAASSAALEVLSCMNDHIHVAEYLCGLPENYAPTLQSRRKALTSSALSNNINLMKFLCSSTGRFSPESRDLTEAATYAIAGKHLDVIAYICTLGVEKFQDEFRYDEILSEAAFIANNNGRFDLLPLFIKSSTKLNTLFNIASDVHPPAWEILKALCDFTGDNRLSKLKISKILRNAAAYGALGVIETIKICLETISQTKKISRMLLMRHQSTQKNQNY